MFRTSYNRAVLRIRISTITPLRIGAGDVGLDPTAADLTCVRTRHARHGTTVYIPGSSLRGVIRAAAEASVRGKRFVEDRIGACEDPLEPKDERKSCSARHGNGSAADSRSIYKGHCLACRLFGSLAIKSRVSLRDLFPWSDDEQAPAELAPGGTNQISSNRLELRHGVSIDRILGSVKHGPFEQELVPAGIAFFGDVALENYQIWQLGLLAAAFDELNCGIAQLGSSKSRGLGVVTATVEEILHEQAGRGRQPCGVAELATTEERDTYGLLPEVMLPACDGVRRGLSTRFVVRDQAAAWLTAGRTALELLQ
jgi:CRISPR-associated RAMP protein (TIGR02581 family)